MAILKEIKENIKAISNIETITKIYEEITNLRMKKIRQEVLKNREFIEELSRVYTYVKKICQQQKKKSSVKSDRTKIVIFLSCNERFHGPLILNIWKEVLSFIIGTKADLAVIGRIGKYLAENSGFAHKMSYFDLDDNNPEKEKIKRIIEFIKNKNYDEVIVFHGRFQTILSQKIVKTNISGETIPEKELTESKDYLLEPSAEAILEFFESELMLAFFNQAVWEHQLSKYASRMISMYQATQNAKKRKRKLEIEQKKLERQLSNKKQIELFAPLEIYEEKTD